MEPILKWAGGKRWVLPKITGALPEFETYYEPFIGSGALFFFLEPKNAVISDTNKDLINCYRGVRDHCVEIIRILRKLPFNKEVYYKIRDKLYPRSNPIRKAAYFLYLNRTCWNGLYRVNREGKFNVPIGKFERTIDLVREDELLRARQLLKRTKIYCMDFEPAVKNAKRGDLVYFDPPYITTHVNNGFIKYNSKLFHFSDERRLAKLAFDLSMKGAHVMVSSAAHYKIKEQYNGPFLKQEINRAISIAGDPAKRTRFNELLITNFDLQLVGHPLNL